MRCYMAFFLRARHWQIFLVLFGVLLILSIDVTAAPNASTPFWIIIECVLGSLWLICFVSWLWSVGSILSLNLAPNLRLPVRFFHFALAYFTAYCYPFFALPRIVQRGDPLPGIIFPLHFFAMFCGFYALYFVSRSLVQVELGRRATFYDYSGPFFLIWFFPLGIWFVQPRVNRLYAERTAPKYWTAQLVAE